MIRNIFAVILTGLFFVIPSKAIGYDATECNNARTYAYMAHVDAANARHYFQSAINILPSGMARTYSIYAEADANSAQALLYSTYQVFLTPGPGFNPTNGQDYLNLAYSELTGAINYGMNARSYASGTAKTYIQAGIDRAVLARQETNSALSKVGYCF